MSNMKDSDIVSWMIFRCFVLQKDDEPDAEGFRQAMGLYARTILREAAKEMKKEPEKQADIPAVFAGLLGAAVPKPVQAEIEAPEENYGTDAEKTSPYTPAQQKAVEAAFDQLNEQFPEMKPETAAEPPTHTHTHTHTHTGERAEVSAEPPAEMKNAQDHPANGFAPALIFHGKGSSEKREIFERLVQYRQRNGLGSLVKLAEATNGVLDTERIRDMMNGAKAELATWKVVGAALDYLETKGM